jgi:hypothetical protein
MLEQQVRLSDKETMVIENYRFDLYRRRLKCHGVLWLKEKER